MTIFDINSKNEKYIIIQVRFKLQNTSQWPKPLSYTLNRSWSTAASI